MLFRPRPQRRPRLQPLGSCDSRREAVSFGRQGKQDRRSDFHLCTDSGRESGGPERAVLVGVDLGLRSRGNHATQTDARRAMVRAEPAAADFGVRCRLRNLDAGVSPARAAASRSSNGTGRGRVSCRVSRAGGKRRRRGGRGDHAAPRAARSGHADRLRQGGGDCRGCRLG